MIKRLSTFILLFSIFIVSHADRRLEAKLNDSDQREYLLEIPDLCNILLELTGVDEDGNAKIDIEIENRTRGEHLCLFYRAYPERELKKTSKIKYEKGFLGRRGERKIHPCDKINRDIRINPYRKERILSLSCKGTASCTLPFYIIKEKESLLFGRKRLLISSQEVIELELEVDLKPDSSVILLETTCQQLLNEYEEILFCPNKHHRPSLEEQKDNFQRKIDSLVIQIDRFIDEKGWNLPLKKVEYFEDQKKRLNDLDLSKKESDCGGHRGPIHRCAYCRYTPLQISQELEDTYKRIYVSSDQGAAKTKVINKINAVYNCPNAKRNWKKSEFKNKIIRYYNEINQF